MAAEAKQEFTHIATPEENAYIEAFHSILQREVIERFEFTDAYDTKLTLDAYMEHYNDVRLHGAIGRITPNQKWEIGMAFSPIKPDVEETNYICKESSENENLLHNQFVKSVQLIGG